MKTCSFPLDDLSDGVGAVNELRVPILSFLCEINGKWHRGNTRIATVALEKSP